MPQGVLAPQIVIQEVEQVVLQALAESTPHVPGRQGRLQVGDQLCVLVGRIPLPVQDVAGPRPGHFQVGKFR